jgi:erythronate-4-phosphate dehydrogenase
MKIVIDENIPFIRGVFEPWASVVYSPGRAIDKEMVRDADALIVRTRTICNSMLLEGSSVRIVASATIGFDHIDTGWLETRGIKWVNAPGCNSGSVMQYITAALFFAAVRHSLDLRSLKLGVVGIGNVGSKVVRAARALGMTVLQNDPPRERKEGAGEFVSLDRVIEESDILTLHVPLTMEGIDKTFHLFNDGNLSRLKRGCILINTSRGEVVDNPALRNALSASLLRGAVLDVWEDEPDADRRLLELADLATPHIAGYSVDGKANATIAVVNEVSSALGITPLRNWQSDELPQPEEPFIDLSGHTRGHSALERVVQAVRHTYPVDEDDRLFRANPGKFEFLRNNYRKRREFSSFTVRSDDPETMRILKDLGFNPIQ